MVVLVVAGSVRKQITCLSGGWAQYVWQFQFHGSGSCVSLISNSCHRRHHFKRSNVCALSHACIHKQYTSFGQWQDRIQSTC